MAGWVGGEMVVVMMRGSVRGGGRGRGRDTLDERRVRKRGRECDS